MPPSPSLCCSPYHSLKVSSQGIKFQFYCRHSLLAASFSAARYPRQLPDSRSPHPALPAPQNPVSSLRKIEWTATPVSHPWDIDPLTPGRPALSPLGDRPSHPWATPPLTPGRFNILVTTDLRCHFKPFAAISRSLEPAVSAVSVRFPLMLSARYFIHFGLSFPPYSDIALLDFHPRSLCGRPLYIYISN